MTCAAIGRDSPKPASASSAYQSAASSTPASSTNNQPRERAVSVNDDTNISVVSADSTKSRGKTSLKRKAEPVYENRKEDTPKTPASKRRSSPINPIPSKSAKYSPTKSVLPELSAAATDASLLSHLSITNPTLYRQLAASASWPSAAAYASAAYPLGLSGLTPSHVGYNPYLYPAWSQLGLSSLTSSLSSAFPLNLPQMPEQPAEPDKACNWGNCSEKFSTTEALGEHVKVRVFLDSGRLQMTPTYFEELIFNISLTKCHRKSTSRTLQNLHPNRQYDQRLQLRRHCQPRASIKWQLPDTPRTRCDTVRAN